MSKNKNFEYLGSGFQLQLLNQLVVDKDFAKTIIDVIDVNYFENKYFKLILQMIKEYYSRYENVPNYDTLKQLTLSEIAQENAAKLVIDTIKKIQDAPMDGQEFVQEKALKFCKQQELQKVMVKAQKIIDGGEFENYDKVEQLVRDALQVGQHDNDMMDVFSDLDEVLEEDYRHPIPMGIPGIDRLLKGGLAKGEIGVVLAPTGVGKTTMLTKIANSAFNHGYNVLQIFFEDNKKIIQRKHYTLWTKIHPDELTNRKEEVQTRIREIESTMDNKLILCKMPSDNVTISQIKNKIRKMIADGVKIDMVVLDYIDCVISDRNIENEWKAEGAVMRSFESMCHELDLVGWCGTQGGRCVSLDTIVNIQNKGDIMIKDVILGDKIMTHAGYKEVNYVFPIEKQPVYKIKTKSGKEIKVSAKHRFPTDNNEFLSIQSGLTVGSKLFLKKD